MNKYGFSDGSLMALDRDGRVILDNDINSVGSSTRSDSPHVGGPPTDYSFPIGGILYLGVYMLILFSLMYYLETTHQTEDVDENWIVLFAQCFGIFGLPAIVVALVSRYWTIWAGILISIVGEVFLYFAFEDLSQEYVEVNWFLIFPILCIPLAILFRNHTY